MNTLHNNDHHIKEQLQACSDFLSLMVHQLRTPLTANKWALHMFQSGDFGTLTPEGIALVQKMIHHNNQALVLLQDIHQANHLESWKLEMQFSAIDCSPVIKTVIENFSAEALASNVTVINNIPESTPKIYADEQKIIMVFQNILENAIKYNKPYGTVTITAENHRDQLVISFHDTGIGIHYDDQKKLFTKFFRAPQVMTTHQGTGLGLFVARQIIEAHHGALWVESELGVGTTFFISIPLAK